MYKRELSFAVSIIASCFCITMTSMAYADNLTYTDNLFLDYTSQNTAAADSQKTSEKISLKKPSLKKSSDPSAKTIGAIVGTTGIGVDFVTRFSGDDGLGLRFIGGTFSLSIDGRVNDIVGSLEYRTDLNILNVIVGLDYKTPLGIYFTVGGAFNDNSLSMSANPISSVTFGDRTFTAEDIGSIRAEVGTNKVSPYVGLGFNIFSISNFNLGVNAGVFYHGSPEVKFLTTSGYINDAVSVVKQSDIDAEMEKINSKINKYKWYPVISLSLLYEF